MSVKARLLIGAVGWFLAAIGGALMFAAAVADRWGGYGFIMVVSGFFAYRYGASGTLTEGGDVEQAPGEENTK